jgi:Leucine-rich repeat (LRR) protein
MLINILDPSLNAELRHFRSDVGSNRLTSIPENAFSNMGSLTSLSLGNNQIADIGPKLFTNMTKLQSLYVADCQFISSHVFYCLFCVKVGRMSVGEHSCFSND